MITVTLLVIVFVKMENRRLGYSILLHSREKRVGLQTLREKEMVFAKLTRLDRVEKIAQTKLELQRAAKKQILRINGDHVVVQNR